MTTTLKQCVHFDHVHGPRAKSGLSGYSFLIMIKPMGNGACRKKFMFPINVLFLGTFSWLFLARKGTSGNLSTGAFNTVKAKLLKLDQVFPEFIQKQKCCTYNNNFCIIS